MYKKSKSSGGNNSSAPGCATTAGNQNMDVRFSMKSPTTGKKMPGKTEMDMSAYNQKAKNVNKISSFATATKK